MRGSFCSSSISGGSWSIEREEPNMPSRGERGLASSVVVDAAEGWNQVIVNWSATVCS